MNRDLVRSVFFYSLDLLVIGLAILWAFSGTKTVLAGETVISRLATVYALTHHRTFYIRDYPGVPPNPFEDKTIDKVKGKKGIISSKPPVLSIIMAGEYILLRKLGFSLDNPDHLKSIVRFYIFSLIIPLYVISLIITWLFLKKTGGSPLVRTATIVLLSFGTQWSAFSCHFTNHLPGGALLLIYLYCLWNIIQGKNPILFGLLSGILASLVFTIDLPLTIFVVGGFLYALWLTGFSKLIWVPIGALPILALHFTVMFHITGNILPVQISNKPFLFEDSYWRHPIGIDALHHPKWLYAVNIMVGAKGLFLLYPVLILFILNFIPKIWRSYHKDIKIALFALGVCFLFLNIYYIFSTNNYGGMSYGFRWHTGSMPILALGTVPILEKYKKNKVFWLCWFVLFLISTYSTFECRENPWTIDNEWTTRLIFGPLSQ
ncbi:MAG: hypothetical protein N3G21_01605 [Candidatus Hydrogenedentes bacterium]|nr:hypothetical protein [Candidatus Hydrogenedentota bacterium]